MNLLPNYIEMLGFIEEEICKVQITTSKSGEKAAATLLVITVYHAQAIRFLLEKAAYPSASALMRVLFETCIRAMWLWKCADENQVDSFVNEDKVVSKTGSNIYFKDLVKAVELAHGLPEYLSKIQENTWKGLNSLTHGGTIQLHRNFDGKTIQPCYDDDLIDELIEFSTMLTGFAFDGLMKLCDNQNGREASMKLLEQVKSWLPSNSDGVTATGY